MLTSLYISNYVLIEELEISFSRGLTVITGETGAGKSIILGAIGLLAGKRADINILHDSEKKCVIEGCFTLSNIDIKHFFDENDIEYETETTVRREISSNGKSRAFINDTPVNLNTLKDFGERLLNIHSQHESLLIAGSRFQMDTIDSYAGNNKLLATYRDFFQQYKSITSEIEKLKLENETLQKETDYYNFLYDELKTAEISVEQFYNLEQEQKKLANSEKITTAITSSVYVLNESEQDIISQLKRIESNLRLCSSYSNEIEDLAKRLSQSIIEISDINESLQRIETDNSTSEKSLEEINLKLDEYNRLMHKHKCNNIEDLITTFTEIEQKLSRSLDIDVNITKKEKEAEKLFLKVEELAQQLHSKRKKLAIDFSKKLMDVLAELNMGEAIFEVSITESTNYNIDGKDVVTFNFTANRGGKMQAINQVASGGELSRIMLGIKSMIAARNILPTIIFDEIDTGVSGKIAAKMGNILLKMGETHQIIAITHLPQIASRGQEHINVVKNIDGDQTKTQMHILDKNERVNILAKMLGDENVSNKAIEMAKEMLKEN